MYREERDRQHAEEVMKKLEEEERIHRERLGKEWKGRGEREREGGREGKGRGEEVRRGEGERRGGEREGEREGEVHVMWMGSICISLK